MSAALGGGVVQFHIHSCQFLVVVAPWGDPPLTWWAWPRPVAETLARGARVIRLPCSYPSSPPQALYLMKTSRRLSPGRGPTAGGRASVCHLLTRGGHGGGGRAGRCLVTMESSINDNRLPSPPVFSIHEMVVVVVARRCVLGHELEGVGGGRWGPRRRGSMDHE